MKNKEIGYFLYTCVCPYNRVRQLLKRVILGLESSGAYPCVWVRDRGKKRQSFSGFAW